MPNKPHGISRFVYPVGIDRYITCNENDDYNAYIKLCRIYSFYGHHNRMEPIEECTWPRGNLDAPIMVVGQNPGGRGIKQYPIIWTGSPLSEFFLDIINEAGIFEYCWFTNLVPWPTKNNRITKLDIEKASKIFINEVKTINPSVIITLGNQTYEGVFKVLQPVFGNYSIFKMLHPSYVKRFYSNKEEFLQTYINKFKEIANEYTR